MTPTPAQLRLLETLRDGERSTLQMRDAYKQATGERMLLMRLHSLVDGLEDGALVECRSAASSSVARQGSRVRMCRLTIGGSAAIGKVK